MLCVFLGRPATASSVAEAPTDAVVVPAAVVRKWITTDERIRSFVFETMASRLMEVLTLAVEISVSRMDSRLASLLMRLVDLKADRTLVLTHDELAAELGTAREVVSRLLKEFERAGALHLARGHITVVDPSKLVNLAPSAAAPLTD
jgi:CRP/FNR family transcriptional regulator